MQVNLGKQGKKTENKTDRKKKTKILLRLVNLITVTPARSTIRSTNDQHNLHISYAMANQSNPGKAEQAAEFNSYYLQRATKEFGEDLDKVRNADDFKNDGIAMLIHALQQGTAMFSEEDQRRILGTDPASGSSTGNSKTG